MKKLSYVAGLFYTSLLVFILICIDQLICGYLSVGNDRGFAYIALMSWAVYFLSGATPKGGIDTALGYIIGVIFPIVIIFLAGVLSSLGFFAVPLAAMVVIFCVLFLEKLPKFNVLAACLCGAGCYLGVMTYVLPDESFGTTALIMLLYSFTGLTFGLITVAGRGLIAKTFKSDKKNSDMQ
jgi:hypothetical protein